jgi:hypothetical protein
MTSQHKAPRSARRLLIGTALVLLAAALLAIGLILSGVFDPQPLGPLSLRDELNRSVLVSDEYQLQLLQIPAGDSSSVRLEAALESGSWDIGYGLKIGTPERSIVVAVSPLGYVTIREIPAPERAAANDGQEFGNLRATLPWQTWPHVAEGTLSNEIWVDIKDSKLVSVRINRELLWTGSIPLAGTGLEFWAASYAEPALIQLKYVELFSTP